MGYFKKEIKDLENEFIPLFEYIKNPMFDIYPELPISIKAILKCITFYGVEGENENSEKTLIDLKQFDPNNKFHKFKIDYDLLNEKLDFEVFKNELNTIIEEQQNEYYLDLKQQLEKSQNDITFKIILSNVINLINQSITALEKLNLNSIQSQVSKLYLKSYTKHIFDLKRDYSSFCPELFIDVSAINDFNEEDFFNMFFKNEISRNRFKGFEKQLIKSNYLGTNYNWLKDKISLVRFFKYCVSEGLINKYYEDKADILHQLEKRYNIDLGDQSKPSKFKNIISYKSEFSFLK